MQDVKGLIDKIYLEIDGIKLAVEKRSRRSFYLGLWRGILIGLWIGYALDYYFHHR